MRHTYCFQLIATGFSVMLLTSCFSKPPQIDKTVVIEGESLEAVPDAQRFGYELQGNPQQQPAQPQQNPMVEALTWDRPEAWAELPPARFRDINFDCGDQVMCWVTFLSGDGGGMERNVGRWAQSVGVADPETTPISVLKHRGDLFDGIGSHTLRDGTIIDPARMLAIYVPLGKETIVGTVTIKMVGPQAAVDAKEPEFRSFIASLRPKGAVVEEVNQ